MKLNDRLKKIIIETVCLLYILLFVYAAVSKLLDFENFQIQLGQSPLLSVFANYVAYSIILIELIIVMLLSWPRWKVTGLFFSLALMTMFTTYIIIILNYSAFVPCSCGGILEKMGWREHLIFNLIFIVLSLIGLLLSDFSKQGYWGKLKPLTFTATLIVSNAIAIAIVVILYFMSEEVLHKRNNFVRRFPKQTTTEYNKIDLKYNSYYFAGIAGNKIYLGNTTAPRNITIVDTALQSKKQVQVTLDQTDFRFLAPQVAVKPPFFYLFDGTVPCIYSGKTKDWKAYLKTTDIPLSTSIIPMDTLGFALRLTSLVKKSNELVLYDTKQNSLKKNKVTLQKQTDGIFDTDGILLYNPKLKKLHYVYYYRNQYLTFDTQLNSMLAGKTIDTVSKAKIKVVYDSNGEGRMASPPLTINKNATVCGKLLFIKSDRIGKFEDKKMLQYASVIDIYNIMKNEYLSSIYVYHLGKEKLKSFAIHNNKLYTISGNYLSAVKLNQDLIDNMR